MIELMVVSSIFVILSAVVLANHARFGSRVVLSNLAHDIALSIRQAQVFGIAVQRFGSDDFDTGYGMYFVAASPNQYVLYGDAITENGIFDSGETVRATTIAGGYRISNLCAVPVGSTTCSPALSRLDVYFKRPEPDAFIRANGDPTLYREARITVRANNGDTATVVVSASGQIYVD